MKIDDYLKANHIVTGRGATAIYLVFKNESIVNSDVLVPGNICYAAVYPIIYSNNNPIFCDVDATTGNLTLDIIRQNITKKTKAIIVPHMYGNTVNEMLEIKDECIKNNIVLIEDCASSFGGINEKYGYVGTIGDYVIYSFGYSKIIDLGQGGILSSDRDLKIAKKELESLSIYSSKIKEQEKLFSKMYREVRNGTRSYLELKKLRIKDVLLYRNENGSSFYEKITEKIIESSINMHIENYNLYDCNIRNDLSRYKYNLGSIPWRFSLILDKRMKSKIIKKLLDKNMPVSDWYPNVTEFFINEKIQLTNVDIMEKMIVNFPLDIDKSLINQICYTINNIE